MKSEVSRDMNKRRKPAALPLSRYCRYTSGSAPLYGAEEELMTGKKFFSAWARGTPPPRNVKMRRQKQLLLITLACVAFASVVFWGCLHPFEDVVFELNSMIISTTDEPIWKGEAASHAEAETKFHPVQKNWTYRNTNDNCIYQYDGSAWVMVVDASLPTVETNIAVTGGYAENAYAPVRVYFTDGMVADGYIDGRRHKVMLYDDAWNGGGWLTFHTLKLRAHDSAKKILLSREFDNGDPIELKIDSGGELQFREAVTRSDGKSYYPIDTAGELALIGRDADTLSGNYYLNRSIDLLGVPPVSNDILMAAPYNWKAIGKNGNPFMGIFDGNGKYISNLYVYDGEGLFGIISAATLKGINVYNASVSQGYNNSGGIVGNAEDGSTITGCSFSGTVLGRYNATGGIAGYISDSQITNCEFSGEAAAMFTGAGGIVGTVYGAALVSSCENYGVVRGGYYGTSYVGGTGGIAGQMNGGTVTACRNAGAVTGNQTGGVVGYIQNSGAVTACYNTGTVTGKNQQTGGVAGKIVGGAVTACYNTGTVTGTSQVGGVAGYTYGSASQVTACYNTGAIFGSSAANGVIGDTEGGSPTVTVCYWLDLSAAIGFEDSAGNDDYAAAFSGFGDWPQNEPGNNWGAGGTGDSGNYWQDIGDWNGGDPKFPKLWW
jgi:hypothetical protein